MVSGFSFVLFLLLFSFLFFFISFICCAFFVLNIEKERVNGEKKCDYTNKKTNNSDDEDKEEKH